MVKIRKSIIKDNYTDKHATQWVGLQIVKEIDKHVKLAL